ncbi:MAG: bifunctional pyr operon transcriptional regulator/uracil phosphoribosyltransferase PyrR [Myxococcota bacterium]
MASLTQEKTLLNSDGINRALDTMARDIVTSSGGVAHLAVVGIHTGGVHLARRLCDRIAANEGTRPPEGMIDITLYRDDVFIGLPQPVVGRTEMPFDVSGIDIVLVDDVLYTGRTVRSALDAIIDYGRPGRVRLAVLADRGLRELPVQADHVGLRVETERNQSVKVHLVEEGAEADEVVLYRKEDA